MLIQLKYRIIGAVILSNFLTPAHAFNDQPVLHKDVFLNRKEQSSSILTPEIIQETKLYLIENNIFLILIQRFNFLKK